jgi:hypothetical protein
VRDVAFGLFLLFLGLGLTWITVLQYRRREVTGETIFDLVGAAVPPLKQPMFWISTLFLGLLAVFPLVGSVAFFMRALGID